MFMQARCVINEVSCFNLMIFLFFPISVLLIVDSQS